MPSTTKTCERCHVDFLAKQTKERWCGPCKPLAYRDQNRARCQERSRREGRAKMGETRACIDCAEPFVLRSVHKVRCTACQKRRDAAKQRDYIARTGYRDNQRNYHDRLYFGGNRKKAIERDGGACVRCSSADRLHVHHKDGKGRRFPPELQNNGIDNLITLCGTCHQQLHAEMERMFLERHPETVREVLEGFLHSNCAPQTP